MSTFEKQFGHLKEKDTIAYYDLKGNPCGTNEDPDGTGCVLLVTFVMSIILLAIIMIKNK